MELNKIMLFFNDLHAQLICLSVEETNVPWKPEENNGNNYVFFCLKKVFVYNLLKRRWYFLKSENDSTKKGLFIKSIKLWF